MVRKSVILVSVLLVFNIQGCRKDDYHEHTVTATGDTIRLSDFTPVAIDRYTAAWSQSDMISAYDDIMIEVGRSEGHDWRMLAAIAYCESRFVHEAESSRGAKGLMQIMPVVARQFGIPVEGIADPKTNVLLAAKLLNALEEILLPDNDLPYGERMKFILAGYNCGAGHLKDAMNLARKYDADHLSWDDVARYLELKSDPGIAADEVVRHGRIRNGRSVVAFVDNVIGKYDSYCRQFPS